MGSMRSTALLWRIGAPSHGSTIWSKVTLTVPPRSPAISITLSLYLPSGSVGNPSRSTSASCPGQNVPGLTGQSGSKAFTVPAICTMGRLDASSLPAACSRTSAALSQSADPERAVSASGHGSCLEQSAVSLARWQRVASSPPVPVP